MKVDGFNKEAIYKMLLAFAYDIGAEVDRVLLDINLNIRAVPARHDFLAYTKSNAEKPTLN